MGRKKRIIKKSDKPDTYSDYVGFDPAEGHPDDFKRAKETWARLALDIEDLTEPELEYLQAQIRDILHDCYRYVD